jgi:hypothetical protein
MDLYGSLPPEAAGPIAVAVEGRAAKAPAPQGLIPNEELVKARPLFLSDRRLRLCSVVPLEAGTTAAHTPEAEASAGSAGEGQAWFPRAQ